MSTLLSRLSAKSFPLAVAGVLFASAVPAMPVQAQVQTQTPQALPPQTPPPLVSFSEQISGWAIRLEAEAARLEQVPPQPATRIGGGNILKLNAAGERVGRLSQRLVELGLLADGQQTQVFDAGIEAAVRAFQTGLGLKSDGVVGTHTRTIMERTPGETALLLRRTATSMRQFLASVPSTVVLVNLPSQTTTLVRKGQIEFAMRAAVGKPDRETPLLSDAITHVIVNPTWTVPPTVLKADKLPNLRKTGTPGIDYADVYLDGEMVIPETVDWSHVSPGRVRIVQSPGDHNALGRFRFNLTNDQNIYLHGTNDPRVFARDMRAVSSGCVRLEDARRMAEVLLGDAGITPARIDTLLATGEPQWIKLPRAVPVRFVYWMATVGPNGEILYHPDIYKMGEEEVMASSSI